MADNNKDFDFNLRALTMLMLILPCPIRSHMHEGDVCTSQLNAVDYFYPQSINYSVIENSLRGNIEPEEDCGICDKTQFIWDTNDNSSDGYISFRMSLSPAVYRYLDDDTSAITDRDNSVSEEQQGVTPSRISERKCNEYARETRLLAHKTFLETADLSLKSILLPCVQKSLSPLIGGGKRAEKYEFPHMAAIGWITQTGGYTFRCGGTLISTNFVLTAGHCTYDPLMTPREPAVVFIGDNHIDHDYQKAHNSSSFLVLIKSIQKHPSYKSPSFYNDIALFELIREIPISLEVRPACLWNRDNFDSFTTATGTGWGYTQDGIIPEDLQKVTLSLFDNKFCKNDLRRYFNRRWSSGFVATQMCAWDLSKKKDICKGDSGGPLTISDDACIHYVVGITSFSVKNRKCVMKKPSVYTRVASYLDWIESVVWKL